VCVWCFKEFGSSNLEYTLPGKRSWHIGWVPYSWAPLSRLRPQQGSRQNQEYCYQFQKLRSPLPPSRLVLLGLCYGSWLHRITRAALPGPKESGESHSITHLLRTQLCPWHLPWDHFCWSNATDLFLMKIVYFFSVYSRKYIEKNLPIILIPETNSS
jgi:hypothetical protein